MNEFEFLLEDRIAKIRSINEQYDLENNSYIAFSGGKDSTILSHLIDLALPNNKIPRVFANTGVEYTDIVKFVKSLAKVDSRFIVVNNTNNIKVTLEKYGYPFKSKTFAQLNYTFYNMKAKGLNVCEKYQKRIDGVSDFEAVPKILKYLFKTKPPFRISHYCCIKLKKETMYKWERDNNKKIAITGIRKEEGGNRRTSQCLTKNAERFNPLVVINEDWIDWFIDKYNIKLCKLYYPPYNFKRTGCKGCPFNHNIQKVLDTLKELLPNEYKQCEIIWKPVYDEYRRIGYRLRKE